MKEPRSIKEFKQSELVNLLLELKYFINTPRISKNKKKVLVFMASSRRCGRIRNRKSSLPQPKRGMH